MFGRIGEPRKYGVYTDRAGYDIHIVAVKSDGRVTYRVGYVVNTISRSYWDKWSEQSGFTQDNPGIAVRTVTRRNK